MKLTIFISHSSEIIQKFTRVTTARLSVTVKEKVYMDANLISIWIEVPMQVIDTDSGLMITVECPDELFPKLNDRFDKVEIIDSWLLDEDSGETYHIDDDVTGMTVVHEVDIHL